MYRVRKLNRKLPMTPRGGGIRRPRLNDFTTAYAALMAEPRRPIGITLKALQDLNRHCRGPRGTLTAVREMKQEGDPQIVVPISEQGCVPSLSEITRVATAFGLREILHNRNIGPLGVALWGGIPASFDSGARCVIPRSGEAVPTAPRRMRHADDVEVLLEPLPETSYTKHLREVLNECWDEDPLTMKMRLLFRFFECWTPIALVRGDDSGLIQGEGKPGRQPRLTYRSNLAHLLENYPVLSLVSPLEGGSLTVDSSAAAAMDASFVHFPEVAVTVVEGKVERWLEKFDLQPEDLLTKVQPTDLVNKVFPGDPLGEVRSTREELLSKLFRLQDGIGDAGFAAGAKSIDKIATRLDKQLDQLSTVVKKNNRQERETAMNQLTKARSYLRPLGRPQSSAMSVLHYLNFYGPGFARELLVSLEISDGRHQMVYLGK